MKEIRRISVLLGLLFLVITCTKDSDALEEAVLEKVDSDTTGRAVIGPEGGEVESEDGSILITIPKGALSKSTEIRIEVLDEKGPFESQEIQGISPVYKFSPSGLEFDKPIRIKLVTSHFERPFNLGYSTGVHWDDDGKLELVGIREHGPDYALFEISSFSKLGWLGLKDFLLKATKDVEWQIFNFKWEVDKIKWYVEDLGLIGVSESGLTPENISYALRLWEGATNSFQFQEATNIGEANIIFREVYNIENISNFKQSCSEDFLAFADENLGYMCPNGNLNLKSNLLTGGSFTVLEKDDHVYVYVASDIIEDEEKLSLIAHEVGHALGLAHINEDDDDLDRCPDDKIFPIMAKVCFTQPDTEGGYPVRLHEWDLRALGEHYDLVEDDLDFDGVSDSDDLCANTPNNTDVDENGCPVGGSSGGKTYVPDDQFELLLERYTPDGIQVSLGSPYSMGDGVMNDSVLTERIEATTSLRVGLGQYRESQTIYDLTGLEGFTNLDTLRLFRHRAEYFDPSNHPNLKYLQINLMPIEQIDLSSNQQIKKLDFRDSQFTSLDLSMLPNLDTLYLQSSSQIETLAVHANIKFLNNHDSEGLKNLSIPSYSSIETLNLWDNNLDFLDVSTFTNLYTLSTSWNNFDCVKVNQYQLDNLVDAWKSCATCNEQVTFKLNCDEDAPKTFIPDNNFEQALIDAGYDNVLDDYVNTDVISEITSLNLSEKGIQSLQGIQDFVNLQDLNVFGNELSNIDVSKNTQLTKLVIKQNQITSLDISKNPLIEWLSVSNNPISNLDLSNNTNLQQFFAFETSFSTLDFSRNGNVKEIYFTGNQLENINISQNLQLDKLAIQNSKVTSLDVSANINLTFLDVYSNELLTCVQVSQFQLDNYVDTWTADPGDQFLLDCAKLTFIPDQNFEQALIDLGYDALLDSFVYTFVIETVEWLEIRDKNIRDLTGIEDFTSLTHLNVAGNPLEFIDVRQNSLLVRLDIEVTNVSEVDLSNNPQLNYVSVNATKLSEIDVSNNPKLEYLIISNNPSIRNINLSANPNLIRLDAFQSGLESLDISLNVNLNYLDVGYNQLECIKVNQQQLSTNLSDFEFLRYDDGVILSLDCGN